MTEFVTPPEDWPAECNPVRSGRMAGQLLTWDDLGLAVGVPLGVVLVELWRVTFG
jgi:hypothetical protein